MTILLAVIWLTETTRPGPGGGGIFFCSLFWHCAILRTTNCCAGAALR